MRIGWSVTRKTSVAALTWLGSQNDALCNYIVSSWRPLLEAGHLLGRLTTVRLNTKLNCVNARV
jgi:hypothetical protein